MNFSWSKDQLDYKKAVIAFAQNEITHNVVEKDHKGEFPMESWQKCAQFGIQSMAAPAQYGGQKNKVDILTSMLAMEGFGYGCQDNGLAFGLNAQMWTVQLPIAQFGTEAQKQKFLPALTSGQWIGAHALTEQDAGSDLFSMKMTAKKVEGGYILNGQKRLVSLAPVADVALVLATVNPDLGRWGITAFLVEKGSEGFRIGDTQMKMGLRTIPFGDLFLEDCFVSEENRLGKEGAGFSLINHSLEYERCCILASQLGRMEHQLEESIDFARKREQFGQPIGKFQSVSNRIVDMKLRLETSRLLLYKVAWLKSQGKSAMMEAALLKLQLSESFIASSLDAIRSYGGNGYLTDLGIERDMRDAVGGVLYAGTSDIQRNIISKLLGL